MAIGHELSISSFVWPLTNLVRHKSAEESVDF